jgi:hypothetical protein
MRTTGCIYWAGTYIEWLNLYLFVSVAIFARKALEINDFGEKSGGRALSLIECNMSRGEASIGAGDGWNSD